MVKLDEDFKPSNKYTPHLIVSTIAAYLIIFVACTFWLIFPAMEDAFLIYIIYGMCALGAAGVVWIIIWAFLYYKSVVYRLNETEMTWKRGVLFRKTGIVPYDRITNVDISQGPIMRLFGIYHLKIDTAGGSGKDKYEIRIEGVDDPEPLRAVIMDFVRGNKPSAAATGTNYGKHEIPEKKKSSSDDMKALLEEVAAIRKLLEEKK